MQFNNQNILNHTSGVEGSLIPEVRERANDFLQTWFDQIKEKKDTTFTLKLLYRASDNGCSSFVFHKLCDGQGPTVTFVES